MAKIPDDASGRTFEDRVIEAFDGITVKELAGRLGQSYYTFRNWLKQQRDIPPDVLIQVAKMSQCSLHWLLTGEGPKYVEASVVSLNSYRVTGQPTLIPEGMTEAEIEGVLELARREDKTPNQMAALLIRRQLKQTVFENEDGTLTVPIIEDLFSRLDEVPEEQQRAVAAQLIGELVLRTGTK